MSSSLQPAVVEYESSLAYLNVVRPNSNGQTKCLHGMRCIVVGAGPAGLIFARDAALNGAECLVLEKAGDPRGKDPGYTNRSFNITLNEVGRYVLDDSRAWRGGNTLVGRAVHNSKTSAIRYADYGDSKDANLISIPRPTLRQNMVTLAEEAGVKLYFNSPVTHLDPLRGMATFTTQERQQSSHSADLVVICDGMHSIGDEMLKSQGAPPAYFSREARSTVNVLLSGKPHNLSLRHIHFWHAAGTDSYAVGIPNADGSMGILIATHTDDRNPAAHPYATAEAAAHRLQVDFPELYALDPSLADQLPLRPRSCFPYKAVSQFTLGKRGVIVGDAGYVFPPWAGFGANNAMYSASSLVWLLVQYPGQIAKVLSIYNTQQKIQARLIMEEIRIQSEFFNGQVINNPKARSDSQDLGPLIRQARELSELELDQ